MPDYNNTQALNRYSYVYNNPVKAVDPSGNVPSVSNAYSSYYDFDTNFSNFGSSIASYGQSNYNNTASAYNISSQTLLGLVQQNNSFQQNSFSQLSPLIDGKLQFANSVSQGNQFARITSDVQGELTEVTNPALFFIGGIGQVPSKGFNSIIEASGAKIGSKMIAPGGREAAKSLFRSFTQKEGRTLISDKTGGGRGLSGLMEDGTVVRIRFKPDGTTRIQSGNEKIIFPKVKE